MPFITNDFVHELVEDDDYENNPEKYEGFVITRTLYVWLHHKWKFNIWVTDEYLRNRFEKYGKIESTKVLDSKLEGLVTFVSDRHAYLACESEKDKWVKIAPTWHQPDWEEKIRSPFLNLNDSCLYRIVDYCDNQTVLNLSETCKQLQKLLQGGCYHFPNRVFTLENFVKVENGIFTYPLTLADAEKICRFMGKYFKKLILQFDYLPQMDDKDTILEYLRVVVKHYQNQKIDELHFEFETWEDDYFILLAPILKNVESLYLNSFTFRDDVVTVDLGQLCPNLKKLDLCTIAVIQRCFKTATPLLETFYWEKSYNELMNSLQFFEMNPQIKIFLCSWFYVKNLPDVANHMPNIETLTLYVHPQDNSSINGLIHLKNFAHLTKLKLSYFDIQGANPKRIIRLVAQLENLLELKLCFSELRPQPEYDLRQSLMALSQKLRYIERLDLVCVQLNESTVVDFVRIAVTLKTLHLHHCDVFATVSLLNELGQIRDPGQHLLNELNLFLDNDCRNNTFAVAKARQHNITVNWNCDHRLASDF